MMGVTGAHGSAPRELLRVAIVEDDAPTRDGLATLIASTAGYRCAGRYESVEELLRQPPPRGVDVILLDINLPGMDGCQGVRVLRERLSSTEVLMLTVYADEERVFESICNGAVGYLLKKTPPAKLLAAIREAADGGAPMSPEIARKVVTLFRDTRRTSPQPDSGLTPRELRLLQLLAAGHSYQSAGAELGITINTARSHIRSVYEKLHVHTKSEAVTKALRGGLIR